MNLHQATALRAEVAEPTCAANDNIEPTDLVMVRRIALALSRRLPPHISVDDLVALGNLGLLDARRRFDPRRGVAFNSFASMRIRGAMIDGLREEDPLSRTERARLQADVDAVPTVQLVRLEEVADTAHEGEAVDDLLSRRQALAAMREAIDRLPARQRAIVLRHFLEEQPMRMIANELGISQSRVCQIVSGALSELRSLMAR